ncbi:L-serine ammonia-lyase [Paenarthrobacter sp. RAF9]
MALSVLDLFSVGIGPSSSHTVGPMRAAKQFTDGLESSGQLPATVRVQAELFGSLGATGRGHGSDKAVVLGLQGHSPETVDTHTADDQVAAAALDAELRLGGNHRVDFTVLPYPFTTADQLLEICEREGMSISDVMLANELVWRSEDELRERLLGIWAVMQECVDNGCSAEGILPGGLKVRRRAPSLFKKLSETDADLNGANSADPLLAMEWVNLFALAVNEENAAGGRIVTAPTNGAAGIVPAVLHYYTKFVPGANDDGVVRFLLAAAAVGILFKINASISGAEVGCQGEVGSACSMAAAGLCEVLGGTPEQVENAAEVGIEHNLGLTCDPVGGLVQIPCIERNAIASVKAINAARLALHGDGSHKVSLDKAIKTMRETGADMKSKYKETSRGGLAVNVVEC